MLKPSWKHSEIGNSVNKQEKKGEGDCIPVVIKA